MKGILFNIQKCSIHDGPGIRTTIFLKGCLLRCIWCANPESQNCNPEIMLFPRKCIGCGACCKICPEHAIVTTGTGFYTDRKKCRQCGNCTEICYAEARSLVGKQISAEELFKEIEKDAVFYGSSHGGITVSGGEPLLQPEFLHEFFCLCKQHGIATAIETCGYAKYDRFSILKDDLDLMYIDIKHFNAERHRELTGVDNGLILENIEKMDLWDVPMIIRTPIIPGINDEPENIMKIAEFCRELNNVEQYELLAYHKLGIGKYKSLGKPYELEDVEPPSREEMQKLVNIANQVLEGGHAECFYND